MTGRNARMQYIAVVVIRYILALAQIIRRDINAMRIYSKNSIQVLYW